MNNKITALSVLSLLFSGSIYAGAPSPLSTGTQTVNMTIVSSSAITTSGNPSTLSITLNPAGTGSATDKTTTYTAYSNSGATGRLKISGQITTGGNMPTNTSLTLSLASVAGTSKGAQPLNSTTPVDLVTGIPTLFSDTGTATYTFNVTNGWTIPAASLSRVITLTLISAS